MIESRADCSLPAPSARAAELHERMLAFMREHVLPAEPADVFNPEPEQLWRTVLRRSGGALALVATYPEDPAQN